MLLNASKETKSLLCPAGLAWKYGCEALPSLPLYGTDEFHPSLTGSVLAALSMYGALQNKTDFDFIDYASVSWKQEIDTSTFDIIKKAALKALK